MPFCKAKTKFGALFMMGALMSFWDGLSVQAARTVGGFCLPNEDFIENNSTLVLSEIQRGDRVFSSWHNSSSSGGK